MTDDLLTKWRDRLRDGLAHCPGCKTTEPHCCWVATGSMRTCADAYRDTDGMVGKPPCNGCARQADRLHAAEAVVAALEQTLARSDGCEGGQVASALAAWKAELARLQGDA